MYLQIEHLLKPPPPYHTTTLTLPPSTSTSTTPPYPLTPISTSTTPPYPPTPISTTLSLYPHAAKFFKWLTSAVVMVTSCSPDLAIHASSTHDTVTKLYHGVYWHGVGHKSICDITPQSPSVDPQYTITITTHHLPSTLRMSDSINTDSIIKFDNLTSSNTWLINSIKIHFNDSIN